MKKKLNLEILEDLLADEFGNEGENLEQMLWAARGENAGLCLACHAVEYGVEPDARCCECSECGEFRVFGLEEVVMRLC
jgi:hypothetical protein